MGDRNNPIKFGPEWLRNLARDHARSSGSSSHNSAMPPNSASGAGASGGGASGNSSSTANASNSTNTSKITSSKAPKVQLANLRYGREEMLALYDRNSVAPPELKYIDILYQPNGKPPFALKGTFEDETRENVRGGPPIGGIPQGDRYTMGRGITRAGMGLIDGKPRLRAPFVRQPSAGRGALWHGGGLRMPGYSGGTDENSLNVRTPWGASNGGNTQNRSSGEHAEWASKMFRSKRQGQATNWRQAREEGEEWRSPDAGRPRPNQQDKKERDWGDRPTQDKPHTWNSNRRPWVGGDTQNNEENLPEWAMDNAEACGGTFDSSGAFHGYSNDDTNLPRNQDSSYPLTRSHTHGSFARSRTTTEEGSAEWWASEKAKKLSPKRFDASEVKFKKQISVSGGSVEGSDEVRPSTSKEADKDLVNSPGRESADSAAPESNDTASGGVNEDDKSAKNNPFKPKTFDALMRSDVNLEESNDDRGNFQSVMINPNNSLRQKHQNIVSAASEANRDNMTKTGILRLLQNAPTSTALESEMRKQQQASEDKIVEEIFDMTLDDKELLQKPKPISSPLINQSSADMSASMSSMVNSMPQLSNSGLHMRLSSQGYQGLPMNSKQNMPPSPQGMPTGMQGMPVGLQGVLQGASGMQALSGGFQMGLPPSLQQIAGMQPLLQGGMQSAPLQGGMQSTGMQVSVNQQSVIPGAGIETSGMQGSQLQPGMQGNNMQQPQMQGGMQGPGMQGDPQSPGIQGGIQPSGIQQSGIQNQGLQNNMQPSLQGMTNSALNASLGLPIGPGNNSMGMPGMGGPGLQSVMGAGGIQGGGGAGMPGFQSGGLAGMSTNSSLFLGPNSNNPSMGTTADIPMPNHGGQSNIFPIHGLQHSASQAAFGSSIYRNLMQQTPNQPPPSAQGLADQWYYEDPESNIQGPFSSKEMYNWYRAGFFSPNLMVRRACDAHMRPLGSYGPVVPFAQMDMLTTFPLSSGFDRSPGPHESMLNSQNGLGLESVMNMPNVNDAPTMDSMHFGSVGHIRNPPFAQPPPMVDSLWSQPSSSTDLGWIQPAMNARNESRVNNLPMYFWEQQPSAITSNALLPEEIAKEMKTEDQILAQLRATQNISTPQNIPFMSEQSTTSATNSKPDDAFPSPPSVTPNMEELQKLIQKESLAKPPSETAAESNEAQPKQEKTTKVEQTTEAKQTIQTKVPAEAKQTKQAKNESDKAAKNKENNSTKSKSKKKEEKKEEVDNKVKEKEDDNAKTEKRSEEPSPSKNKKEEKQNKKELEKEKKEWLKEGFTIVKGSEKAASKDKKKVEDTKAVEEAERKRKEEERLAVEDEKKKKQAEVAKKQQQQHQRQAAESVVKKAPWSAVTNQGALAATRDGLTLAEIQRLEREKKLEQMKEQQQMMQIIAQQQAAALAREQEMQAGLGWAKKKGININTPGQSLAEIQAEARKQAAAAAAAAAVAAAAAAQSLEETVQPPINLVPWGNAPNGGGFWDTQPQPAKAEKAQEPSKPAEREPKSKKKAAPVAPKKETTPAVEFDAWCTTVLTSWSSKIDVPTFVGFLKDIESPYEVKDYVKCYLGESKDSNDFARQFLERRSKLLRVGMVTPSDDLCSPAMAVNPRTTSGSDYQEVKGKGKKTKKNKMLKVDARILGFSVTAAEDRINVGDIDTV